MRARYAGEAASGVATTVTVLVDLQFPRLLMQPAAISQLARADSRIGERVQLLNIQCVVR